MLCDPDVAPFSFNLPQQMIMMLMKECFYAIENAEKRLCNVLKYADACDKNLLEMANSVTSSSARIRQRYKSTR